MRAAVIAGTCLALTTTSPGNAGGVIKAVDKLADAMCPVANAAGQLVPAVSILSGVGLRLADPGQRLDLKGANPKGASFKAVVVDPGQLPGTEAGDEVTINVTDPSTCGFTVAPSGKMLNPGVAKGPGGGRATLAKPGLAGEAGLREPVAFDIDSAGRAIRRGGN